MQRPLRIGIAGLGTVGTGVLDALRLHGAMIAARAGRPVELAGVSARSRNKRRGEHDLARVAWYDDPVALARSAEIDVLVELMGGEGDPAKAAVEAALKAGKPVVTANKALLAHHGVALAQAGRRARTSRSPSRRRSPAAFRSSRRCARPRRTTASARCSAFSTAPAITSSPRWATRRRDFASVLARGARARLCRGRSHLRCRRLRHRAQACDPDLARLRHRDQLESIDIEGIEIDHARRHRQCLEHGLQDQAARRRGRARRGIEQRVHPTLVPKGSPVADTNGVFNAVVVKADFVGDLMLEGTWRRRASDGIGGRRRYRRCRARQSAAGLRRSGRGACMPMPRAPRRAHVGGYYIALELHDRPGEVAAIARILAERTSRSPASCSAALAATSDGSAARHRALHPDHT